MDAFKAHFTDNVSAGMIIGYTGVVKISPGYTYKVQPLDVGINKPFKSTLRECWENHVFKAVKAAGDDNYQ